MKKRKSQSHVHAVAAQKKGNLSFLISIVVLLVLTVGMFGDVMLPGSTEVLSDLGSDLYYEFIYLREFGFGEIRQGNFPLWNPYVFSGMPFFGGFQSALLYPPNYVYLILPIQKAINVGIALHVFLAGVFMYLWTSHRRLHPLACLLSSVLLMFCGAHFLHISAGHLSNLCAMVWVPLLVLAIDGFYDNGSLGWVLLGVFAVTMQVLAGHPQYVFYTGVAASVYSAILILRSRKRLKVFVGLSAICVGAAALSAVQLFAGVQAAAESVRSVGLSYELASEFSFPPENMLTLLAPNFLGDGSHFPYWGRCFFWEMCSFVSVTGLMLALYGSVLGDRQSCRYSVMMVLILIMLAFGAHTPLFRMLYTYVPGFNKFRGSSKFIFHASLFIIMLSGIGLDHLLKRGLAYRRVFAIVLVAGLVIGVAAMAIRHSATGTSYGIWQAVMDAMGATGESYLPPSQYADGQFVREAGLHASKSLLVCAMTCGVLSLLLFLMRVFQRMVFLLAPLALIEMLIFAGQARPTFELAPTVLPETANFSVEACGDDRILMPWNPHRAMSLGIGNIWGIDPGPLLRYAEFLAFTQGQSPDHASQIQFLRPHRLYLMLRCRYVLMPSGAGEKGYVVPKARLLPRLQLVNDWRLMSGRDKIFEAMASPLFDPKKTVILEQIPDPKPMRGPASGTVRVLDSSSDHLTIEADLPYSGILLITDNYASGWHARALRGSVQDRYDILPANYILRAVPLSAGHHHFRLEFLPVAFLIGKWISMVSVAVFIGVLVWHVRRGS